MKSIGLIDVDGHNYPNLCLMKIAAYHKVQGDQVQWWNPLCESYDIVYMSKVFSDTYTPNQPEPWNAKKVIRGGTGYAISLIDGKEIYNKEFDPPLPPEIENIYPDYSIYPQYTGFGQSPKKQTAYGFLTRGCPRNCSFCHVGRKEGLRSYQVAELSNFWNGQGTIRLCDPNILAAPNAKELLKELKDTGAKIDINQGIDARLITEELAELLASIKLITPHFAMDNMNQIEAVKRGLKLYIKAYKQQHGRWNWRNAKVFVLTNYNTTHEQDMQRIYAIQECECQPYVMIYNKPSAPIITRRLQQWTNNNIRYAMVKDFEDFQKTKFKNVVMANVETE